jgi:hypothetical protein
VLERCRGVWDLELLLLREGVVRLLFWWLGEYGWEEWAWAKTRPRMGTRVLLVVWMVEVVVLGGERIGYSLTKMVCSSNRLGIPLREVIEC